MVSPLRSLAAALNGRSAYEVLGVSEDAPHEVIKQAHRALVKKWHSDRHMEPGAKSLAEEKTKLLNVAWEILRDHRSDYDEARRPPVTESEPTGSWDEAAVADDPWAGAATGTTPPPPAGAPWRPPTFAPPVYVPPQYGPLPPGWQWWNGGPSRVGWNTLSFVAFGLTMLGTLTVVTALVGFLLAIVALYQMAEKPERGVAVAIVTLFISPCTFFIGCRLLIP